MQRSFLRILFPLFTFLAMFLVSGEAFAASAPPLETEYAKAAAEWRELLRDKDRGARRESWLEMEKRFGAIVRKDPKGSTGAKAQYQTARAREELAKRSARTDDWREAANAYLALGRNYPKHSLADDGLFQAAFIAFRRLDKPEEARSLAQAVLDRYPKGDMVKNARELLASLPKSRISPGTAQSGAASGAKPSGNRNAGQTANQDANQGASANSAAPAAVEADRAGAVTRILCRGTSKRSTVLIEVDGAVSFRHQYLAPSSRRPARLMVDIDGVDLGGDVKPGTAFSGMAVTRARTSVTGTRDKKGVRILLDLGNVRHYTVDAGANPPGIHVQCSVSQDLPGGRTPPAGGKNGPVIQGRFSGTGPGQPGTLMEQLGLTVKTIMLDAGHGGKDPGAMGNGITEKEITLRLTKLLGERLAKQGFTILYTRRDDATVALDQRAVIANNKKADLFISLHVNASKDKNTNGLETYFLDLARTSSAATVAARENAVSVKNISDLQFILADIMLTSKLQESQDLAAIVHRKMFARLRQAGFTMSDNGVRSAPFYVLMGARMPAVLVEIGYLSHNEDARRIKSDKYLERLADGIALGVTEYKMKLGRFTRK